MDVNIIYLLLSLDPVASYRVGLDVSIALEFRTSRKNGVLLTISDQANDGLGLEINQGKVQDKVCRNSLTFLKYPCSTFRWRLTVEDQSKLHLFISLRS